MTGAWSCPVPPGRRWPSRPLCPPSRKACPRTSRCKSGNPTQTLLGGDVTCLVHKKMLHLSIRKGWLEIKDHTYVPGWSTSSPCSRSPRVKSVGWYLGFCQGHGRLRLTTSAMGTSFFESFTRDTWMRLPSVSIWRTKFAVALENIALADEERQSWKRKQKFLIESFLEDRGWVLCWYSPSQKKKNIEQGLWVIWQHCHLIPR